MLGTVGTLEKVEVEIDGVRFGIPTLDAIKGRALVVRLMGLLAPALAQASSKPKEEQGAAVLSAMLSGMTPELFELFCKEFASQSWVMLPDGKRPVLQDVFGHVFARRYMLMFRWLLECCKHNFADFLAVGSLTSALSGTAGTSSP
jgi:hypothetical protein